MESTDTTMAPERLHLVCRLGEGAATCRYLVMRPDFTCAKLSPLRATIDVRAATMAAQGDNCDGIAFEGQW